MLALPGYRYRVKPVLPVRGLAAVIGQSGAGKTFLCLDLAMAIARGRPWFGYRVKPCGVVYLAAEGEFGIAQRVLAYVKETAGSAEMPLEVIPFAVNLLDSESDVQAVLGAWKEAKARMGSAGVLMVDTLSRCMAGGDENSAADMTRFISNLDKMRRAIDGLVLVVHHLGKDVNKGARGHSSFYAALDSCISVTREAQHRSWTAAKARESADGEEFAFDLKSVVLGVDEDGDPITSCVIDPHPLSHRARQVPMPKGSNQKLVLKITKELLQSTTHLGQGLASAMERCIKLDDLIEACHSGLPIDARRVQDVHHDSPMQVALSRAFYWQGLLNEGLVCSGTEIAKLEGLHPSTVNELLRLTLLAPGIVQSLMAGRQPRRMSLLWFQRNPLPLDWVEQRRLVAGFDT